MHWKRKAFIQNVVAGLPDWLALSVYYPMQRKFGGLRNINPTKRLKAGITTWDRIAATGRDPVGRTFFEVGTGRMLNVPMAYWLMGAERTITVDLNCYLKHELILESLQYVRNHQAEIKSLFGERLDEDRLEQLCTLAHGNPSLSDILSLLQVEYHSPADASNMALPAGCIDFHTSYTVLEHIPPAALQAILTEANRLTAADGLIVHGIDYTDHFSHSDSSIDSINFLRFNQQSWDRLAGNRFMYMNRLRHSDYLSLFQQSGLNLVSDDAEVDSQLVAELKANHIPLDDDYRGRPADDLAATFAWIVASPNLVLAKCG